MEIFDQHLLSILVFLPLAGAFFVLLFVQSSQKEAVRWATFLTMLLGFVITLMLFVGYHADARQTMQFIESAPWLPEYGIVYKVGIDGMSLLLFMMTTFLGPLVILSSWRSIEDRVKSFHISMLLLQTAMLGAYGTRLQLRIAITA